MTTPRPSTWGRFRWCRVDARLRGLANPCLRGNIPFCRCDPAARGFRGFVVNIRKRPRSRGRLHIFRGRRARLCGRFFGYIARRPFKSAGEIGGLFPEFFSKAVRAFPAWRKKRGGEFPGTPLLENFPTEKVFAICRRFARRGILPVRLRPCAPVLWCRGRARGPCRRPPPSGSPR